jgi:N-methylhydantoinase B
MLQDPGTFSRQGFLALIRICWQHTLADALPGRVPAAGEGGASMIAIGGRRADHSPFIFVDFVTGGWGAPPAADGLDGNSPIAANLSNVPVEEIEAHDPLRVERYGFLPDTGGAGRFRGCLSVVRQYRFLEEEALLQLRSDRRDHLPYGLEDGWPGTPSSNVLNPGSADERSLPTNVTTEICKGDVFRHITAGGGGYGQPLHRECARVLDDVLDGKISNEYAERVYGVVMVESGDRVDDAATRSLRDRLTAPR